MTASGNRGGGQRSKGDRRFVGTRVPVDLHEHLPAMAKSAGFKTTTDYLAKLLWDDYVDYRTNRDRNSQEELPIGQLAS